jgi:L-alanine-DL-glutamate epimerase-like enolase superfamily enzyme
VRDLVGPDVQVMVDANQRWTPGEAIRRARLYEEFDLAWLEEPVLADNVEGHAAVKASMRFPLATGETVFSVRTCVDLVEKQGTDILQADIARVGGLTQWLKVANVAEVHGVPMAPHYIPEQSIHALCAVSNALIVECIQGGTLTDFGLLLEPVKPIRGRMSPPPGPGLGLRYNPNTMNKLTDARFGESSLDA